MPKASIKLQHILTIPFVVIISLAVLVSGFLTWRLSEQSTLDLGEQLNQQSAILVEERLAGFLKNANFSNNVVKQIIVEGKGKDISRDEMLKQMQYLVKNNNKIGTVGIGYNDGSYFGIGRSKSGVLQQKMASQQTKRMFYTFELPGMKKISERANYDARIRPWFKEALASNTPVWSSVYEMFSSKQLGVTLSEAITDKDSNFVGVVGTDIVFNDLGRQLREMRVTENTHIFISDNDNNLIASSDVSLENISKLIPMKESENEVLRKSYEVIAKKITKKNYFGNEPLTIAGETQDYFINFVPFGKEQGLQWHIGVIIPDSDFLGKVKQIKLSTLIVWVGSFLLSLLVGVLITIYINRSIKQLQERVSMLDHETVMPNDVNHHIQEVQDLSETFTDMSKRLRDTFLDLKENKEILEMTVEERTKELKAANSELLKLSKTDKLTQLANRHSLDEQLQINWDKLKYGQIKSLSFLMCDIDFFKKYNDFYGHLQGDECLAEVAKTISESIRDTDIAARYGGEEFAIIMPTAKQENAVRAAKTMMTKLANKKLVHQQSEVSQFVTMSIGVVTVSADSMTNIDDFIGKADAALYKAKEKGRSRLEIAL